MSHRLKEIVAGIVTGSVVVALCLGAARVLGITVTNGQAASPLRQPAAAPTQARVPAATPTRAAKVTSGFSALANPSLAAAPTDVVAGLQSVHRGSYADAKTVAPGMYLSTNNGALCVWVRNGLAGCTDHLTAPDGWLSGDMVREYDSELAPFEVRVYGFMRDTVKGFWISTTSGKTIYAPVRNNAFDTTLRHASFAEIKTIDEVYRDGHSIALNPGDYFPDAGAGRTDVLPPAG